MLELDFTESAVPEIQFTRKSEPNPFAGKFPTGEGKSLVVVLPNETPEDAKVIAKVKTFARKAAQGVDKTARVKSEELSEGTGKAKRVSVQLTFWTVDRIRRPGSGRKATA